MVGERLFGEWWKVGETSKIINYLAGGDELLFNHLYLFYLKR
jgi:hypothetical protein